MFSAACQPALDGSDRPAEVPGRLLMAALFEITEDQRQAKAVRQALELFVQNPNELNLAGIAGLLSGRDGCTLFATTAARRRDARGRRRAHGDLMEPRPERISHPERPGTFHQDEKRGLESVFGLMPVGKNAVAYAQDHRAMPLDEHREGQLGWLAGVGGESFQKLAVAEVSDCSHAIERANSAVHFGGS